MKRNVIRRRRARIKDPVELATELLAKAVKCKILSQHAEFDSPELLARGVLTFLEASGELAQDHAEEYEKLLEKSACEQFPESNKRLCVLYLLKAKKILREARDSGDSRAASICRVISDYELEKLILGTVEEKVNDSPPDGIYL